MKRNYTIEEASALCTGKDFWHSCDIPEKGIPSITMSDGPHGLRKQDDTADHLGIHDSVKAICFPSASCLAASFDRRAARLVGELLGEEARAEGVHILLGPAMNIKRTPLCGRNFEYYSEDPYLTGELASQTIKGIKSQGAGVCVKHYAANNQENGRMVVSANMDERTLREIYLRAFERVMKESPDAVMSSYNRVNGEYVGESFRLLTEILRGEWGFGGIVISDWYAVCDRVKGILAGMDLEMPGGPAASAEKLADAARNDPEVMNALYVCAERVADTARRLAKERTGGYDKERHHEAAAEIAADCAVLLKNKSGVFPISKGEKVLLVGEFADKPRYQGGGSSHVNSYRVDGVVENLVDRDFDYFDFCKKADAECVEKLAAVGGEYDKIIVFAGLPDEYESEGYDRESLDLPEYYNDVIERAAATGKSVGVVLFNGSPVSMPWLERVDGVLEMGLAGEGAGKACARILTGEVNPSGRLAESYPKRIEHTPSYLYRGDTHTVAYSEGVFVGYRYYSTKKIDTLFPFGYGLSYTKFEYSDLTVSEVGEEIRVSVKVKNVGDRFGKECVQLYVAPPENGKIDRPSLELKGFDKIALDAGEEKRAEFVLTKRDISYYDEKAGKWRTESGEHGIIIGKSAEESILCRTIMIEGDAVVPHIDGNTTVGELLDCPATAEVMSGMVKGYDTGASDGDAIGAKMKRAMLANSPLRLVKSIAKLNDERYNALIGLLRSLTEKK